MIEKLKGKTFIYTLMAVISVYLFSTEPVHAMNTISENLKQALNDFYEEYWFYIAVFIAIGVLTGLLAFIVLLIKLGRYGDNPQERSKVINEMIAVACTTAALGAFNFILALYFSLFD